MSPVPMEYLRHALQRRYPSVRVVSVTWQQDAPRRGILQQTVRYQAPLEALKAAGLLTDETAKIAAGPSVGGPRTGGECLALWTSLRDAESRPGCVDLFVYTESEPRERAQFSTRQAQALLRRIARAARSVPAEAKAGGEGARD